MLAGRYVLGNEVLALNELDFAGLGAGNPVADGMQGFSWLRDLAAAASREKGARVGEALAGRWLLAQLERSLLDTPCNHFLLACQRVDLALLLGRRGGKLAFQIAAYGIHLLADGVHGVALLFHFLALLFHAGAYAFHRGPRGLSLRQHGGVLYYIAFFAIAEPDEIAFDAGARSIDFGAIQTGGAGYHGALVFVDQCKGSAPAQARLSQVCRRCRRGRQSW